MVSVEQGIKVEALSTTVGCVLSVQGKAGATGSSLRELHRIAVIEQLTQHGVIVFDGFGADVEAYEAFTDLFGETMTGVPGDGANTLSGRREVFKGRQRLSAHAEDAYTPWRPDLIWLYCVQPATSGGRTTFYDGIEFLERMSPPGRRKFEETRLRFTQYFSSAAWRARFGATEDLVLQKYRYPDLIFEFRGGDILKVQFTVSAIQNTRLQQRAAFANSVLHALDAPDFYGLDFEDGSRIDRETERELRNIAASLEVPLPWTPRSFAVIDNSRVMHQQRGPSDERRQVLARHQFARFSA